MKYICLAGIMIACLFTGCGHTAHTDDHSGHAHGHGEEAAEHAAGEVVFPHEKAAAAGLRTAVVEPGTFTDVIKASGQILSAQGDEQTIVATVAGIVTLSNSPFTEGAAVRKGQPLLSLVTRNLAEGDVAARTRFAYEKALREYERGKELVKDRIISEKDFYQLFSDYGTARVAYEAIGASTKGGGIQVAAPIGGYLKNLRVKEGDYVETGQAIATVSQNNRLQLRAEVPEKYYASLPLVRSANFRTPYDHRVYRLDSLGGRLLSYARSSGEDAFYVPVTFEFDNRGAVVSGSFVEVYLLASPVHNVISIPVSSLIEEQGIYSVFVQLDEDCYRKQEVRLGMNNGAAVQILSGLKAGDTVVTEGPYHLKLATASNAMPAHTHQH